MSELPFLEREEHTLDRFIACIKRELAMRKRVYPRWVSVGRMTQKNADNEIMTMQEILAHLQEQRRNV